MYRTVVILPVVCLSAPQPLSALVSLGIRSFEAYETGTVTLVKIYKGGMRFSGSARILAWRSDDLRIMRVHSRLELCGIGQ